MYKIDKQELIEYLWDEARYAVENDSEALINRTLGERMMAIKLGALLPQEVRDLTYYLIFKRERQE
jgi:hypothetical protein